MRFPRHCFLADYSVVGKCGCPVVCVPLASSRTTFTNLDPNRKYFPKICRSIGGAFYAKPPSPCSPSATGTRSSADIHAIDLRDPERAESSRNPALAESRTSQKRPAPLASNQDARAANTSMARSGVHTEEVPKSLLYSEFGTLSSLRCQVNANRLCLDMGPEIAASEINLQQIGTTKWYKGVAISSHTEVIIGVSSEISRASADRSSVLSTHEMDSLYGNSSSPQASQPPQKRQRTEPVLSTTTA